MVAVRRLKRLIQFSVFAVLIASLLLFLQWKEVSNSETLNVKKRGETSHGAEDEDINLFATERELDDVKDVEGNAANSREDDWETIFNEKTKHQTDHKENEYRLDKLKIKGKESVDKRRLKQVFNESHTSNISSSVDTEATAAAAYDHRENKSRQVKQVTVPSDAGKTQESSVHKPSSPTVKKFPWSNDMLGSLNLHIWQAWCGNTIHDLRRNCFFPLYPDVRLTLNKLFIQHWEMDYGQRIFGFIHPPVTGNYTFAISSDDSSELWLSSNESPINVKLLAWVGNRTLLTGDFHAKIAQFTKYKTQLSHPMFLHRGLKYFIEVLHKQGRMDDHVLVGWKIPGFDHFRHLSGKSISLFIDDTKAPRDVTVYSKFIPQDLPSHSHGKFMNFKPDHDTSKFGSDDPRDKAHASNFVDERDIANLFPRCPYNPSYLVDFRLNRYDGVNLIHDTSVYPADNTDLDHMKQYDSCVLRRHKDSHGNSLVSLAPVLNSKKSLYENGSIAVFGQHKDNLSLLFSKSAAEREEFSVQLFETQMDASETKKRNQLVENATEALLTSNTSNISRSLARKDQENAFEIKKKSKRKKAGKRVQKRNFTRPKVYSDNKYNLKAKRKRTKEDLQFKTDNGHVHYNEKGAHSVSRNLSSLDFVDGQSKTMTIATGNQRKLLGIESVENVPERNSHSRDLPKSRTDSSSLSRGADSSRRRIFQRQMSFAPIDKKDDMLTRINSAREFVRKIADAVQRYDHQVNASALSQAVYRRFGVKLKIPNMFRVPEYNSWIFHQNSSKCESDGNLQLNKDVATSVVNRYIAALRKATGSKYSVKEIVNIEENHDVLKGDRYLIDVELNVEGKNTSVRLSQYVYQKLGSTEFCLPQQFVVNQHATVHIIIPVKNQGKWVQHFINNMVELYSETRDPHINVIIVDFSSTDIDVDAALKQSALKRYQVRKLKGLFQRAYGIQAGAALVKNPHDIIFMCDLHLQIPSNIVDMIRKHCVLGKMAFAPIVERLHCGFSPSLPFGFWELQGYGLFAIYKADFTRVGGMNYREFRTTWGGEDWELLDRVLLSKIEVERLRVANFYHYYHSKKGMWGTRNMFNTNDVDDSFDDDDTDIIRIYNETMVKETRRLRSRRYH